MRRQARGSEAEGGLRQPESRPPRVRVTAVLSVAAAIGVVIWQALGADSGPASAREGAVQTGSGPVSSQAPHTARRMTAGSEQQLIRLTQALHTPVYWKGPQQGSAYAVTRTPRGWVYVSYVPPGARPPTNLHQYPYVATYPFANAYSATRAVARRPGSAAISAPSDEVAFYYRSYPTSAYLAFRGVKYQIEVFVPNPNQLRGLIGSGQIRPLPLGHP